MLNAFLSATDATRVERTFRNLAASDISRWVLTGGIAIELHILQRGGPSVLRPVHDIDFITDSFASIPESLGTQFLVCHVHPNDPPGKNLFQAVDPVTEVRIDVFRAYGAELERTVPVTIAGFACRMVSLQDLLARHARLTWDLVEGKPVAPKYARDFLRLLDHVEPGDIEAIWPDHRKSHHLDGFAETARQLRRVIASRSDLLVAPTYSTDVHEVCARCHGAEVFPLADRRQVLALLGYC
jgi:hypothetical protein